MMSLPRALVLVVLLLAVGLEEARAGSVPGPKVALHISATTSKAGSICSAWSPNAKGIPCSDYVVQGSLNQDLLVYMVVRVDSLSSGIAGVTAGIEYNGNFGQGVDVTSWTLCTDGLEFPNAGPRGDWPASGGGNSITWITCAGQRIGNDGLHGVVGAFGVYAYSADQLKITPNRNLEIGPSLTVANCSGGEVHLDSTFAGGWAGFWTIGRNPCRLTSTGIGDPLPTGYRLYPNSPNPFQDATRVAFDLPEPGRVTLKVFDVSGRVVRILANGDYPAGNHEVSWNARDAAGLPVAQGIYFVSMQSGSFTDTRRLYLQK